eukprot:TRINITY_DN33315_c0_g1_i1.p2 TRINITY_DN33315_c0_g1~~TRINITY_DN33315_c0_g1_i1.p2  ORF type:complete len:122 (+),score=27.81 TRINITY_DN33315_c0_g1_i1:134-499(+)
MAFKEQTMAMESLGEESNTTMKELSQEQVKNFQSALNSVAVKRQQEIAEKAAETAELAKVSVDPADVRTLASQHLVSDEVAMDALRRANGDLSAALRNLVESGDPWPEQWREVPSLGEPGP